MKKQNIIILAVFVLIISLFSLISCDTNSPTTINKGEVKTYVDVVLEGELERTGEFNIPSTWTVGALFSYAGIKDTSDLAGFNLSNLVEDGKTYYVPKISAVSISFTGKVNINTANLNDLVKINGIGETLALKIISYRQQNPFKQLEDIKNVSGIGDAVYQKIKDFITV